MPTITSAGIGSGLDVSSIIDGLMAVERRPLEILQFKREQIGIKISAYGELLSSVSAFHSAVENLNSSTSLDLFNTTSSNDAVLDITSTDDPAIGSYSVEVTRLAQAHKLASDEILSTTTTGGNAGDALSIHLGADSITVDLSTALSLEAIRDVINEDADNPGFTAAVINGDGDNQKLVITADETGSDNEITFSYSGDIKNKTFDFATVNDIGGDINDLNAEFSVDGYNITRQNNDISDVINGVTFKLLAEDQGNTHTISVGRDDTGSEKNVQAFADAYNKLISSISEQRSGSLRSDGILLSLENQVRSILNSSKSGGTYSTLNDIGLSIGREGNMTLDSDTLQAAFDENVSDVAELFAAEGTGFAWRLANLADQWVGSSGLLSERSEGLGQQISDLDDKQLSIQRNLQVIEDRYTRQFAALDTLVASFQNTGNFLTSQLAQIANLRLDK